MFTITKLLRCQRIKETPVLGLFLARNLHKGPIPVAWEKPKVGWTKLNFDGSLKSRTGKASIGGVFRDHNADFILGYSESIGKTTSTMAELLALRRGLELILENGWSDVWLEGDARELVDIIVKRHKVRSSEAQKYVTEINTIIAEFKNCIVTHIYREGNRAADKFAKMGHNLEEPQVWRDVPPEEVLPIVHEDAVGKIVFRRK